MKEKRTLISFDWALKSILRQKDNFDILEGFLSDLLNDNISIVALLESESNQYYEIDKFNRVDLKAKDGKGREIIIEIQHDKEPDYLGRIYYGTSKTAMENMKVGRRYANVKKIISVSIVYWQLLEKSYLIKGSMKFEDMINNYQEIKIKEAEEVFADYYFIQPTWFDDNIKSEIDEWIYMFKHSEIKGKIKATNIDKAREKLDELKMTPEERAAYDEYEVNKAINEDVLQTKFNEGELSGEQKGKQKIIEAMRDNGMSDAEINKIIKAAD
jgi:predicted transposase/invertase (TIGR01784 family)